MINVLKTWITKQQTCIQLINLLFMDFYSFLIILFWSILEYKILFFKNWNTNFGSKFKRGKNYIVHKSILVCQQKNNLFALKVFDLIYLFIVILILLSKNLKGIKVKGGFSQFFQDLLTILYCMPFFYMIYYQVIPCLKKLFYKIF
jgi:hypothetical protein